MSSAAPRLTAFGSWARESVEVELIARAVVGAAQELLIAYVRDELPIDQEGLVTNVRRLFVSAGPLVAATAREQARDEEDPDEDAGQAVRARRGLPGDAADALGGLVHVHFDPYEDIAWDAPELAIDQDDPRWVLSPTLDPLGATAWYQALPQERQIEIGKARIMNAMKVGAAFESMLIRGLMQYVVALPNGSPEFRYCLHEMTEECNHIQMFQELVNRVGVDVPGMRRRLRLASPVIGGALAALPVSLMVSILAGEEPIDHYQKALLRDGGNLPPAVLRTMEIHIAEEARHISFAHEFVRLHVPRLSRSSRFALSLYFPLAMRIACEEIMTPPGSLARRLGIPRDVFEQAFWRSPPRARSWRRTSATCARSRRRPG